MAVLKKVAIWPFARMNLIISAILGLLLGIVMAILLRSGYESIALPGMSPAAAILVYPLAYGLVGLVLSAFTAWLYNMLAASVGGIELEFEDKKVEKKEKPAEKKKEEKKKK